MSERLWLRFVRFSMFLNRNLSWVYIKGHPLGSGEEETLCKHLHRLERLYQVPWAIRICRAFDYLDKEHCKRSKR